MADSAERRVYFSISKSENSHADNTYEDTFYTDELDSSRRHSDWQQQQTLCVVSSGNVSEWLRIKHHSQSMRSAFHSLCRWIVPLQIRCLQWRGCWLLLPRMNDWLLRISLRNTFFPFAEKWACVVTSTEGMQCRQCWGDIWNQFVCMQMYI